MIIDKVRFVWFILIIIAFSGCFNKPKEGATQADNKAKILAIDTISFDLPDTLSNYYCKAFVRGDYLFYWDCVNNKYVVVRGHIPSGKVEAFEMMEKFKVSTPLSGFYLVDSNSWFFYSGYPPRLYKTGVHGRVVKYALDKPPFVLAVDHFSVDEPDFGIVDVLKYDTAQKTMICSIAKKSALNLLGLQDYPNFVNIDLDNKTLGLWGEYKGLLKKKGNLVYHFSYHSMYLLVDSTGYMVTSACEPDIYKYSRQFTHQKTITIALPRLKSEPVTIDKLDQTNRIRRNALFYGSLLKINDSSYLRYYNESQSNCRVIVMFDQRFQIIAKKRLCFPETGLIIPYKHGFIDIPEQKTENNLMLYYYGFTPGTNYR